MDAKTAIELLRKCEDMDQEIGHMEADDILCKLLAELGYQEVVDVYESLPKWYA